MLPRGEVAWRRFAWRRTLRRARLVIAISEAVKTSLVERYEIGAGTDPSRPPRRRPRALHARRRAARAVPALPGAQLAEQEPRPADRGVRAPAPASGPSCGSCSPAAATRGAAVPDGRRAARPRPGRRAAAALPDGLRARLPEPVRGLRPAAARGDGLRLPGRRRADGRDPRGLRRRGALLRPDLARVDRGDGRAGARASRRSWWREAWSARRCSRGRRAPAATRPCTATSPPAPDRAEIATVRPRRPGLSRCGQRLNSNWVVPTRPLEETSNLQMCAAVRVRRRGDRVARDLARGEVDASCRGGRRRRCRRPRPACRPS